MNNTDIRSILNNVQENYKNIDFLSELKKFKERTGVLYQEFLEYIDTDNTQQLERDFTCFLKIAPDIIHDINNIQ